MEKCIATQQKMTEKRIKGPGPHNYMEQGPHNCISVTSLTT